MSQCLAISNIRHHGTPQSVCSTLVPDCCVQTGATAGEGQECAGLLWSLPGSHRDHGQRQPHRASLLWDQAVPHWPVGEASDQGENAGGGGGGGENDYGVNSPLGVNCTGSMQTPCWLAFVAGQMLLDNKVSVRVFAILSLAAQSVWGWVDRLYVWREKSALVAPFTSRLKDSQSIGLLTILSPYMCLTMSYSLSPTYSVKTLTYSSEVMISVLNFTWLKLHMPVVLLAVD